MVSKRKKKFEVGEGSKYVTRKAALKILQLTLKDFRRLCILKGIYPREPHNRKKAQKGASGIKTLYYKKDIQFLMHEPIIWKLRDVKISHPRDDYRELLLLSLVFLGCSPTDTYTFKRPGAMHHARWMSKAIYSLKMFVFRDQFHLSSREIKSLRQIFAKKVARARALRDFETLKKHLNNHPVLTVDHIVKERYPTFIDALRDLDDCLTLCFLFSTFPSLRHVPRDQSALCRRLTVEFMHAVIAAKALRKVFISIKGYYYQAEIRGQTITWIVPHHFAFEPQAREEVDFKVMSTFVEFYTTMLGFVNFRLYHLLNLYYPPILPGFSSEDADKEIVDEEVYVGERIAALNAPLSRTNMQDESEEIELDEFPVNEDDTEKLEQAKLQLENIKTLKSLFKGLKFFINREVPREPMVFIIRCFGGEVSWDRLLFVGATFDETDEAITHQIVDRPNIEKKFLGRWYVQPQWIFDSVNACKLLPVTDYVIGAVLPPHLSPFVDKDRDQYIPPEERAFHDPSLSKPNIADDIDSDSEMIAGVELKETKGESSNEEKSDNEAEETSESENDVGSEESTDNEGEESSDDNKSPETEHEKLKKKSQMSVSPGMLVSEDPQQKARLDREEYRLREKMIPKKYRNLYKSMMKGRMKRNKEAWLLRKKRRIHDEQTKTKLKADKKIKKSVEHN